MKTKHKKTQQHEDNFIYYFKLGYEKYRIPEKKEDYNAW